MSQTQSSSICVDLVALLTPPLCPACRIMCWWVLRRAGTQTHSLMDKLKFVCPHPVSSTPIVPPQLGPKGRSSTCLTWASVVSHTFMDSRPSVFLSTLWLPLCSWLPLTLSSVFLLLPWHWMRLPVFDLKKRFDRFWLFPSRLNHSFHYGKPANL